jgi:YcxB-like protein
MPITGTLTLSDYFAALRVHYRPGPWRLSSLVAFTVLMVWAGAALGDWWLLTFPICIAAVYLIYVPLRGRRSFRQNKALSEPMTIEVRPDGVFFEHKYSNGLLPWAHIYKCKSNDRIALLYRTSAMFHLIPQRFFDSVEDYKAFIQTVSDKKNAWAAAQLPPAAQRHR